MAAEAENHEGDEGVGDVRLKAVRVMTRILAFIDSVRPLESPCSIEARIARRCFMMLFCSFTNVGIQQRRDTAAPGRGNPFVEGIDRLVDQEFEDGAKAFAQVVGPAEPEVGVHNPGELGLLLLGYVLRVFPKRVAGVLHPGGVGAI